MTDDFQIDVGGHFWSPEEKDPLVASIEAMLEEYGERLLYFIRAKQAEAEENGDRAAIAARGVLWPKMKLECFKSERRRSKETAQNE